MADLDTGHLFLTTLAPIRGIEAGNKSHTSFEQNVRIALGKLPTAMQSPATQNTGINSPFARNKRTHLARMFVLSNTVYNGRNAMDPIVATIKKIDTANPLPVDQLNASYLVFCADIDAVTTDGAPLPTNLTAAEQKQVRAAYAKKLWETMGPELKDIYGNCVGFENVDSADKFAVYLDKCHVETTMPFHDYYLKLPKFHNLPVKSLLSAVAIPAIIALISLVLRLFGMLSVWGVSTLGAFVAGIVLAVLAAIFGVKYALSNGAKPLATGEYDDLPSVLKALYLQQTFSDFVIGAQGKSAKQLHADFGAFVEQHKPTNKMAPSQSPGVISITAKDGLIN